MHSLLLAVYFGNKSYIPLRDSITNLIRKDGCFDVFTQILLSMQLSLYASDQCQCLKIRFVKLALMIVGYANSIW
jgi:hypothetical protein